MPIHLGLIVVKPVMKYALEMALEYYVSNLSKKNDKYHVHHIDEICNADHPDTLEFKETYITKVKGYCTLEEAMEKINNSQSQLAMNIKQMIIKLHEADDYIIIDNETNVLP
jgi:hypothetical protein